MRGCLWYGRRAVARCVLTVYTEGIAQRGDLDTMNNSNRAWAFGSDEMQADLNRDAMPSQDEQVCEHFEITGDVWEQMSEDDKQEKRDAAAEAWEAEALKACFG